MNLHPKGKSDIWKFVLGSKHEVKEKKKEKKFQNF